MTSLEIFNLSIRLCWMPLNGATIPFLSVWVNASINATFRDIARVQAARFATEVEKTRQDNILRSSMYGDIYVTFIHICS